MEGSFHVWHEFDANEWSLDEEDVCLDDVTDSEASIFSHDGDFCGLHSGLVGAGNSDDAVVIDVDLGLSLSHEGADV